MRKGSSPSGFSSGAGEAREDFILGTDDQHSTYTRLQTCAAGTTEESPGELVQRCPLSYWLEWTSVSENST